MMRFRKKSVCQRNVVFVKPKRSFLAVAVVSHEQTIARLLRRICDRFLVANRCHWKRRELVDADYAPSHGAEQEPLFRTIATRACLKFLLKAVYDA
jgi:hypothetical protein